LTADSPVTPVFQAANVQQVYQRRRAWLKIIHQFFRCTQLLFEHKFGMQLLIFFQKWNEEVEKKISDKPALATTSKLTTLRCVCRAFLHSCIFSSF
jgi:hypothetical protein